MRLVCKRNWVRFRESGGAFPPHGTHQSGMDVDVETPSSDTDLSHTWYRTIGPYIRTTDTRDEAGHCVINVIAYDPTSRVYYATPYEGNNPQAVINSYNEVYNNEDVLRAINEQGLFIDNVEKNYSLDIVRADILSFQSVGTPSGATAGVIWYNDPRTWDLGVIFQSGHGGHFHVNIQPPPGIITGQGGPHVSQQTSTALGFGSDEKLYYRFEVGADRLAARLTCSCGFG